MKKALIVVNHIGFFHFLWHDIDMLNNMGYKVYAIADNEKNEVHTIKILESKSVIFYNLKIDSKSPISKNNIKAYFYYKKIIEKEQFDLIHCHTPIIGLFVRLAARKARKQGSKVVYTTHGLAYTHISSWKEILKFRTIESFASHFCDAIITINKEDFDNVKKLHCKNVYHINGVGVDVNKYSNCIVDKISYREELGVDINKILILSIGELSHRKNHSIIIRAIASLPNKSDYIYAICGREMTEGGTKKNLLELARLYNVDLRLLGFRDDVAKIIQCSDIGAIPSIREGLGLAGIETLSAGIPLVGSDVQGIKEYIIDGKTGYLCYPYNDREFADAIIKLSDENVRKQMADACRNIALNFDTKVSVSQRLDIYKSLLNSDINENSSN